MTRKTLAEIQAARVARCAAVLQKRRAGRTLRSIADELGITRERVRQIEASALLDERRAAR